MSDMAELKVLQKNRNMHKMQPLLGSSRFLDNIDYAGDELVLKMKYLVLELQV